MSNALADFSEIVRRADGYIEFIKKTVKSSNRRVTENDLAYMHYLEEKLKKIKNNFESLIAELECISDYRQEDFNAAID